MPRKKNGAVPRPADIVCGCGVVVPVAKAGPMPKGCKKCASRAATSRFRERRPQAAVESTRRQRAKLRATDPGEARRRNRVAVAKYRAKYPEKNRARRAKEAEAERARRAKARLEEECARTRAEHEAMPADAKPFKHSPATN